MNMFSLRATGAALLFFIIAIDWNTRLSAQTVSGSLVGTVLDASGSGVSNAKVDAVNVATNVRASTNTTTAGAYQFANLPVGTYDVTASATGFTTSTLKGVAVALNQTATANLNLQVGSVSSTVDVSAAAAVIDTTTAQVQSTFETRQAQDLPTSSIGLGVINLSLLSAGVASNGGLGSGIGPSVGGQRPHENNFTVEGIDNNNKSVTGPLIYIPNDAVQSFTLLQNQFSPEYGHSAGGQFNTVVRSGTNELHGSVYEYLQNRNLNAVDQALANQQIYSNPRYDQSRLGATIGGPILKNKLFYFGNFEYNPVGASATPAAATLTPTAAGYSILAGLPGISKTNLGVLQQYAPPAPVNNRGTIQVGAAQIPVGVLPLASPNFLNSYYLVTAVDYNMSDKDQFRGRFIYNKQNGLNPNALAALPAFYVTSPSTFYLGTLTEYHNFTPSLTNEFRLGYNRYNNTTPAGNFQFPGLDQFPNIIIDNLSLDVGPYDNAPQFTIQNTYSAVDNVNWVKGNHTLTFGEEARKYIAPQQFTQRARGAYEYSSLALYLQDVTPDQLAERTLGAPTYYGDQTAFYSYVNDVWRIRPNLTLNLGLRHEFTSVPFSERLQNLNAISSVPGLISFNSPQPQYTNFAPRIGVAYSPGTSGRTSIRAGFGMAYDVLFDNIGILELPPQFSTTIDSVGTVSNYLANGGIKPNAPVGPALTQAQARAATSAFIPNQEVPYAITWNFGVQ
ncbi:MAG: Cna domain protein, partial [Bryobacterales bacterium]|nr:Cna domain protein [Bryobacterales bacterium]